MAYLAELGALTDELVTIITTTSPTSQPRLFRSYRESALRGIRNREYLQTNQFAVEEQLRGLVERFSVVGRDGLAEALRQRLDLLSRQKQSTKWTPEVLHLLLELSDQPVKKSNLDTLVRLREANQDPGLDLKWEHIAREDGWAQDRDLWKNVDFADSSEDEAMPDSQSPVAGSDDTSMSSATALILREVLFLLNGLPTSLFGPDCTPVSRYQLSDVSWDTYRALVNSFAEYGRTLLPLRKFSETTQDVPLVQAFQDSVCQCLRAFDKQIASVQGRYVEIKEDTVVSLIALQQELKPYLVPLAGLSNVVRQLQEERYAHSFRFLELLYDATCIAQLSGDDRSYHYLGEIFFDCFRVYIRPIRQWMEGGELTPGDKTFFVAEASASVPPSQIWSDKFNLRRSQEGQLHAPRFLHPAVQKIFNTGKSVVVLKHLGRFQLLASDNEFRLPDPPLDFASACGSPDLALAPFSELFDAAFDRWVQSKHLSTSSNLSAILFESCGLWDSLDTLQHIYFMSDGSLVDTFTSSVFASLDALSTTWTDRFTLTELAQEAWSPCPVLESYRLSASFDPEHIFRGHPDQARSSVRNSLPGIRLSYKLAWPVRLVITREAITKYELIFTLLLQLRRAATIVTASSALLKAQADIQADDHQQAYYALRARLLWFATTLHSYLTTIVLVPETSKMRTSLQDAEDIDAMIEIHALFARRVVEEACLGAKLAPIRDCVLDVLDLAIRLEDGRRAHEHDNRTSMSSSSDSTAHLGGPSQPPPSALRGVYVSPREKEREEDETILFGKDGDENDDDDDYFTGGQNGDGTSVMQRGRRQQHHQQQHYHHQTYAEILAGIRADFDRHLRFITGGLRGVARASTDTAAAKWDLLAEMLEMGFRGGTR
ncbi:hypothetical protein M406DRAFT_344341 [Cryphonectria parasitica EP155]|uniref:Spindle pole body component n=1 Tax=Cryphonectria parasitica (strain ATCC 38755 / EP155) TaxID=660469 RepID=A0A9P4YDD6_CRYP1|nr:uncharacterized protein M406DRAFT_344341 [Cryphonectria parasitica EP155]KAF3770817.1 hypothetical protein M406DRAFT_344341 [Cryphonectria parasitica EP155]